MFAANADVFAPGDSFGIRTTTSIQNVPDGRYAFNPPSVILGAAALVALLWANHHVGRSRGRSK